MKMILTILLVCASCEVFAHQTLGTQEVHRIADAIYRVEGGRKAKVPYGILSMKVRNAKHAREICVNTIRNTHERWKVAGRPREFIDFLADRYCPPTDSEGKRNWKKNMRSILGSWQKPAMVPSKVVAQR